MRDFGPVAETLRRCTVHVLGSRFAGSGSGIVWDGSGLIVTNAHVVREAGVHIELWDGTRLPARTVKRDPRLDLATLQVEATGLPAAVAGDSASLRPGELAIAVGNPLGFVGAVSTGVIHGVGTLPGLGDSRWVQSSVRLAPGNSGGPLANARGEVIGVNSMIVGGAATLSLAIPAAVVLRFLRQFENAGVSLGLTVRPVRLSPIRAGAENGFGFLILEVQPGSLADEASLQLGDLLVGANGLHFRSFSALEDAIDAARGALPVQFRRGGVPPDRTATLLVPNRRAAAA